MPISIRRRALLGAGAAVAALPRRTRAADKPIRIGVLTDMAGPYAANTGLGSVLGAQMAVEDFMRNNPSIKAEVVQADLQLKPDVAVAITRDWCDNQGVDVVTDVPLSSAAFAIADMVKQKDKVAIFTGAASAAITGDKCGPNHIHFVYDTWSMPHAVVDAAVKEGRDSWFFITADYAFGHSLQKDAAGFVTAAGGKVVGQALAPFPGTTDFSAFLVQAKASGAKAIGLANGGNDTVNCIKQAAEFGIMKGGQQVAGLIVLIQDVHGVGLQAAQGVLVTEPYLLEPQPCHARIRSALCQAFERSSAELVAGRPVRRSAALPEGGGGDGTGRRSRQRARRGRADEGDADGRSDLRQGTRQTRRTRDPRHASVRGEVAGSVEGALGLLHAQADGPGRSGIPSTRSGWLHFGTRLTGSIRCEIGRGHFAMLAQLVTVLAWSKRYRRYVIWRERSLHGHSVRVTRSSPWRRLPPGWAPGTST